MASYVAKVVENFKQNPAPTDYRLVLVKGIPQNPTFDKERFEELIDTFQTTSEDVFISTYVKAGRFISESCI